MRTIAEMVKQAKDWADAANSSVISDRLWEMWITDEMARHETQAMMRAIVFACRRQEMAPPDWVLRQAGPEIVILKRDVQAGTEGSVVRGDYVPNYSERATIEIYEDGSWTPTAGTASNCVSGPRRKAASFEAAKVEAQAFLQSRCPFPVLLIGPL